MTTKYLKVTDLRALIEWHVVEDDDEPFTIEEKLEPIEKPAQKDIDRFYARFVERTKAQIMEEFTCAQKSTTWFNARKYCITASIFGNLMGHNKFESRDATILSKLSTKAMGKRGLNACNWGNTHEDLVRKAYERHARESLAKKMKTSDDVDLTVTEYGLIKSEACPWMGVSPDGITDYTNASGEKCRALLEIKCPVKFASLSKRKLADRGISPYADYGPTRRFHSPHNDVPWYYYDQIQGIMGYLNKFETPLDGEGPKKLIKFCDFVVWSPDDNLWITRVPFDQRYFDVQFATLQAIYFDELLPRFFLRFQALI